MAARRLIAAASLSSRCCWSPTSHEGAALLATTALLGSARALLGQSFSSQPEAAESQDPAEEWRARAEKEARGRPLSKDPSERLSVISS